MFLSPCGCHNLFIRFALIKMFLHKLAASIDLILTGAKRGMELNFACKSRFIHFLNIFSFLLFIFFFFSFFWENLTQNILTHENVWTANDAFHGNNLIRTPVEWNQSVSAATELLNLESSRDAKKKAFEKRSKEIFMVISNDLNYIWKEQTR